MKIESVEWSTYNLSPESLIEAWGVAASMAAVLSAVIRVKEAPEENLDKAISLQKK